MTRNKTLRLAVFFTLLIAVVVVRFVLLRQKSFVPLDEIPSSYGKGGLDFNDSQMVLKIQGAPEELGEQHGRLLKKSIRKMVQGYVIEQVCNNDKSYLNRLLARVQKMKPALPKWYLAELAACARAAGVDEDILLLAQSEGDIASLEGAGNVKGHACSAYVLYGRDSVAAGNMIAGRNFDYAAGNFIHNCVTTMYVAPDAKDGHSFVSVGWVGILGGWTLLNEHGLLVANHLGGGPAKNPAGIPTLVMSRIIAQKASDIDEALALMRRLPRMRGQILWMAQPEDKEKNRGARAVAVEYDADKLYVREAEQGVLIVTNQNLVFGRKTVPSGGERNSASSQLEKEVANISSDYLQVLKTPAHHATAHTVFFDFSRKCFHVAHGCYPAYDGKFAKYRFP